MAFITKAQRSGLTDTAFAAFYSRKVIAACRNGVARAVARALVVADAPDGAWQLVGNDGRVRLHGRSLHALARLTVEENDQGDGGLAKKSVP